MIEVTRLPGTPLVLNADMLEAIEASPDTTLLLGNGRRYVIRESVAEVMEKVAVWKRRCFQMPLTGEAVEVRKRLEEAHRQEN
jgi:flagellar protein FlbD